MVVVQVEVVLQVLLLELQVLLLELLELLLQARHERVRAEATPLQLLESHLKLLRAAAARRRLFAPLPRPTRARDGQERERVRARVRMLDGRERALCSSCLILLLWFCSSAAAHMAAGQHNGWCTMDGMWIGAYRAHCSAALPSWPAQFASPSSSCASRGCS